MRRLLLVIVALCFSSATITSATAAEGFAYWSYWQGDSGAWTYARVGPASLPARDGAVDGWRFGISSATLRDATPPAIPADFTAVCGAIAPTTGMARVALVIDPGADAQPYAHCAVVAEGLSRAAALSSVTQLRTKNGFICAINGFPATGCAEDPVPIPSRDATTPTSRPTATANEPTERATLAPATNSPTASAPPATTSPAPTSSATPAESTTPRSLLPTVLTIVLALLAFALARRNAARQTGNNR